MDLLRGINRQSRIALNFFLSFNWLRFGLHSSGLCFLGRVFFDVSVHTTSPVASIRSSGRGEIQIRLGPS